MTNSTEEMIQMATMTPTEFAEQVDSNSREVRKFLRSVTPKDEQPGKGSRWTIPGDKRSVTKLQKQFGEWKSAQDRAVGGGENESEDE